MALSLYAATVPSYKQILGAVAGLLDKAQAHCAQHSIAPGELIQARLAEDMLPFAYQVKSTVVHSRGAIEGCRRGVFSPDTAPPPDTFAALKSQVTETIAALDRIAPAEIESLIGRDMRFEFKDYRIDFNAEDFLLSFSQPQFYFHATTAYDILRWKGVTIGKRDFMGQLRRKG